MGRSLKGWPSLLHHNSIRPENWQDHASKQQQIVHSKSRLQSNPSSWTGFTNNHSMTLLKHLWTFRQTARKNWSTILKIIATPFQKLSTLLFIKHWEYFFCDKSIWCDITNKSWRKMFYYLQKASVVFSCSKETEGENWPGWYRLTELAEMLSAYEL